MGKERTIESLTGVLHRHGPGSHSQNGVHLLGHVGAYLKLIPEKCSEALHILDRFHTVAKMNKARDEVRAEETRRMQREGRDQVLKKSRWLLLRRSENLGDEQHFRLRDLLSYKLRPSARTCSRKLSSSSGTTTRRLGRQVPRFMWPPDHAVPH